MHLTFGIFVWFYSKRQSELFSIEELVSGFENFPIFHSCLAVLPTMPSTQEEQISLKLLVYKKTNKVILAEAGKDFVDVLFCFLTMPLGTIARLVQTSDLGPGGVGCLSSLYGSVTNLQEYLFTVT